MFGFQGPSASQLALARDSADASWQFLRFQFDPSNAHTHAHQMPRKEPGWNLCCVAWGTQNGPHASDFLLVGVWVVFGVGSFLASSVEFYSAFLALAVSFFSQSLSVWTSPGDNAFSNLHFGSILIGISPAYCYCVLLIALSSFSNSTFLSCIFFCSSILSFIAYCLSSSSSFSCLAFLCLLLSPTIFISL